jgi:outer membrane protein assembly factor BamB
VQARGEVLAPPAATETIVIVRTVDGRLRALDPSDGHELWSTEEQVTRLTLRGTAAPVISGDMALCGFDNGRVVAVGLADGDVLWETTVAPHAVGLSSASGRYRFRRQVGDDIFVVRFGPRGNAGPRFGQVWCGAMPRAIAASSWGGRVHVSASDGDVIALRRRDGTPLWTERHYRRELSAPAIGATIVMADFEASCAARRRTGDFLACVMDGHRITNALAIDGLVS